MKKTFLLAFLLLPCLLSAEAFQVVYATGSVKIDRGTGFKETAEGELVEETASLQVGQASLVELTRGAETLRLSHPGTYWLSGLAEEKSRSRQAGLTDLVWGKVAKVFSGSDERRQSTPGGVRAERMTPPTMNWSEGKASELIEAGEKAFSERRFGEAVKLFLDAGKAAEDPEEAVVAAFHLAAVLSALGKNDEALHALEGKKPDPTSVVYSGFHLLRGKLLLDASAYDEVIAGFSGFDFVKVDPASAASALLLTGLACLGKKETATAKAFFQKALSLAPGSAQAKAAAELLQSLPPKP